MNTRQSRIAQLKKLDPGLEVFGACLHRYETDPVSLDEMVQFESALGVTLPDQYRQHLLSVGYGAGPYYGLYSPEQVLQDLRAEYRLWEQDPEDRGPTPSPSIAFPFTRGDARRIYEARAAGNVSACGTTEYPSHGAIPIGTKGCSFDTILVTAGELRGTVWDLNREGGCPDEDVVAGHPLDGWLASWCPALQPSALLTSKSQRNPYRLLSALPTFSEWFDRWLEVATGDLKSL